MSSFDADARARVAAALDRDPVVAVRLLGSQATGETGPRSDVDLGVWLRPGDALSLRDYLGCLGEAVAAAGREDVDLVLLNEASPLLRHRAIRDGVLLLERDPRARVRLEARAISEYLDTQPLRDEVARGLRARIAEGTFGRR